jgi:hypothetical protein
MAISSLVAGLVVGEAAAEDVEKEAFGQAAVDRRSECVVDRSDERCVFGVWVPNIRPGTLTCDFVDAAGIA